MKSSAMSNSTRRSGPGSDSPAVLHALRTIDAARSVLDPAAFRSADSDEIQMTPRDCSLPRSSHPPPTQGSDPERRLPRQPVHPSSGRRIPSPPLPLAFLPIPTFASCLLPISHFPFPLLPLDRPRTPILSLSPSGTPAVRCMTWAAPPCDPSGPRPSPWLKPGPMHHR